MIYNNQEIINNKKHPILFILTYSILFIVIFFIIFSHIKEQKSYYQNKAIVINDNNYYVKLSVNINDINIILNNSKLIINKKEYQYIIKDISDIQITNELTNYQIITLEITNLDDNYKINNLIIDYKILKKNEKLIKYIKEKMEE